MANILVVDDDDKIRKMIMRMLSLDGHQVDTYPEFSKESQIQLHKYDLILLDIMMPGMDGFEVCRTIRNDVDCPIIFITAKSDEQDIVYALGLGGDDYIQKPFGMEVLRARVNAHLRRECREHHASLAMGDFRFELQKKELLYKEKIIPLTKGEYEICEYLARNKGQVFSKEQIYEAVFGCDGESNDSTIATHVKNIRNKMQCYEKQPIKTMWGIGYKWENTEN